MSDCRLAHGGSTSAALNSYVDTQEIAGRTAMANFLTPKCSSADCSLIQCAVNTPDANCQNLMVSTRQGRTDMNSSTSWQSSEWTSSTERQLSLLHYWSSWREMQCTLNKTYQLSLAITEAMGSNSIFDSKLCVMGKLDEEYFNFQAFGIFDYKDKSTSTRTQQLLPHFGGKLDTFLRC